MSRIRPGDRRGGGEGEHEQEVEIMRPARIPCLRHLGAIEVRRRGGRARRPRHADQGDSTVGTSSALETPRTSPKSRA